MYIPLLFLLAAPCQDHPSSLYTTVGRGIFTGWMVQGCVFQHEQNVLLSCFPLSCPFVRLGGMDLGNLREW